MVEQWKNHKTLRSLSAYVHREKSWHLLNPFKLIPDNISPMASFAYALIGLFLT